MFWKIKGLWFPAPAPVSEHVICDSGCLFFGGWRWRLDLVTVLASSCFARWVSRAVVTARNIRVSIPSLDSSLKEMLYQKETKKERMIKRNIERKK